MKIQKNLTDQDMLKNFTEKDSFETTAWQETNKPTPKSVKQEQQALMSLPSETIEKLDKALLQLRINLKQQGINDVNWQIVTENNQIILKAVTKKK